MISKITENSRLLAKHTIIYLFKIDQRTRMNVERASNESLPDNISHLEHDPESDAKWARFKLRVSQQRQTPCPRCFCLNIFTILSLNFFRISVVLNKQNKIIKTASKSSSVEKHQSLPERFEILEFRPPVHALKFKFK